MQSTTLIPAVAVSVMLLFVPGWERTSDPPVTQGTTRGIEESFEAGCRVCHDTGVPDRHHALSGTAIPSGSQVPYPDSDGNGAQDFNYGCLNCHDSDFTVVRDCIVCHTSPAGTVPDGVVPTENPVTVAKTVGAGLTLSWDGSCSATDTDYVVYEGTLGNFTSHTPILCSTAGAPSATFAPSAGNTYYLVVPRNHWSEGSYGVDTAGTQRPASASACLSQSIGCPWF